MSNTYLRPISACKQMGKIRSAVWPRVVPLNADVTAVVIAIEEGFLAIRMAWSMSRFGKCYLESASCGHIPFDTHSNEMLQPTRYGYSRTEQNHSNISSAKSTFLAVKWERWKRFLRQLSRDSVIAPMTWKHTKLIATSTWVWRSRISIFMTFSGYGIDVCGHMVYFIFNGSISSGRRPTVTVRSLHVHWDFKAI